MHNSTFAEMKIRKNPYFQIINAAGKTDDEKAALIAIRWNRVFFRRQSREAYDAFLDYLFVRSITLAASYSSPKARMNDDALRQKLDKAGMQDAQELLARQKEKKTGWESRIRKLKDNAAKADDLRATCLILVEAEKMFDTHHRTARRGRAPEGRLPARRLRH